MIQLVEWLIFGHIHHWETQDVVQLLSDGRPVGRVAYLKCTKCGKWKRQELG